LKSRKKVLVLVYNRFTNDSRVLKECTSLVEAGFRVELWAIADPQLPKYEVINGFVVRRKLMGPRKKKISLYKRVKPYRVAILKYPRRALLPFPILFKIGKSVMNVVEFIVWNLVLYVIGPPVEIVNRGLKKLQERRGLNVDFVHCNDLLPLPFAVNLKKRNPKMKIIYDSHEYQTEAASLVLRPEKKQELELMERDNIKHADEVITVSPSIAEEYKRLYELKRIHIVKNCPPLTMNDYSSDYFRKTYSLQPEDIIFLYQGALMRRVRGLEEMINCFFRLEAGGYKNHHIVFMGWGNLEAEIKDLADKHGNIHFHPSVRPEEIPEISSSADYGVHFPPNNCKSYDFSLPNKLFEYIACGLPVIVTPLFEMKRLVQEEKIGYVAKDFTEDALLETLKGIKNRPSEEMRSHIRSLHRIKYNWQIEEKVLLQIYKNVA
jgi:glycosyltransferase involved in cell wall biosynthesis